MDRFVLKGTIVYSRTATELSVVPHGFLVCVDGVSRGVFSSLPESYRHFPLEDHGNCLIIPGLVDLHIHAPQFPYRGTGMDLELIDWLDTQAFPEEARYADLSYARTAYSLFASALRRSVTTRACIFATRHRPATELLMELMEQTGLVTCVGKVNMDQNAPQPLREENADHSAAETKAWLDAVNGRFSRTHPILTPRFVPSCSHPLMTRLGQLRSEYGLPVQSHLSENRGELALVRQLHPKSEFYGQVYHNYGLFGKAPFTENLFPTVMAHCVLSGEEEQTLLRENGVYVAHCPASNMNLSSGIAPIRTYLDRGLRVGLGTDVAGGQSESMFRAVTDAIQVSKLYWRLVDGTASPLTFPEAFYLATKGGGGFFGRVGSFDEGFALDALVLDDTVLPTPTPLDGKTRLERALYLSLDLQGGIRKKYVQGREISLDS